MSARGSLVTSPGSKRSRAIAESANNVPLFWLAFLSSGDLANAEVAGQYPIDRKRALERAADALPFLSALFPEVPKFAAYAKQLIEKLRAKRSPTIGIEVVELLCEDDQGGAGPTTGAAVEAIEGRDPDYLLALPARTIRNPFLPGQEQHLPARTMSIRELLMEVCWLRDGDLTSRDEEAVECRVIGYGYPGGGLSLRSGRSPNTES